ncbi:MAG: hypothetical protein E7345_02215 [Clostridiales bacterium]|nr:hypothetical protein [Clostridiales bacterium]
MNNVQKIIKEICEEKGINFKLVSKDWVIILEKGKKIRYITGYKFPLNNQAVSKVCDDKFALYDVIKEFNIPVAEHVILFKNYDKQKILNYCEKYNFKMVVKSNTGTCGNDMFYITKKSELFKKIDKLLKKHYSLSLSPYYDIKTEYRNIVLNNNVELVYGKKKPVVIGDGKSTIYELLCEFNKNYFEKIKNDGKLKKVLKENEIFEYNWQFNLSKGSMPFMIDDNKLVNKLKKLALEITQKLGTSFVSVDIIELTNGELLLLEVNSGVMMDNLSKNLEDGYDIAKNIYSKVIDEMFK